MISKLYKKLINKENISDLAVFIREFDSFEEIPIVTRYSHLDFLGDHVLANDTQSFLINLAFFLLNNIKFYAKKHLSTDELSNFFVCLTFCDFEDYKEIGFVIPKIFVTRKKAQLAYLNESSMTFEGHNELQKALIDCNLFTSFTYLKTVTQDKNEAIERIYAIPLEK